MEMDQNTFQQILNDRRAANNFRAMKDASDLARAFVASNGNREGLYACLRLLDTLSGREGGYLSSYLDGAYFVVNPTAAPEARQSFADYLDSGYEGSMFDYFRDEAFTFLATIG